MAQETALAFPLEINSNNRYTMPSEVMKVLGAKVGDIVMVQVNGVIPKKGGR